MPSKKDNSQIFIKSPLLESKPLEEHCGRPVYLKMESSQPSGSFKVRGAEAIIKDSITKGVTHLLSASGGNAGMATAYVGRQLDIPVTVYLPKSTPSNIAEKLRNENAEVIVHGNVWKDCDQKVKQLQKEDSSKGYVHPYIDERIWKGYENIVEEIVEQCPETPGAIVLSVGGGGLLNGIMQGIIKVGLEIPIISVETEGANCLNLALKAGKPILLEKITSIAVTLGASTVTDHLFDLLPQCQLFNNVISDHNALEGVIRFADDHRVLVEPACGATMYLGYSGIIKNLIDKKVIKDGPIVFIVCGGNGVSLDLIKHWKKVVNYSK